MSFLSRLFTPATPPLSDLWVWITSTAREARWYLQHGVADTVDGRFDMVALVTSLVMLRLEELGLKQETSLLTERFVDDMDGSLRDIGIGDLVIGKKMGHVIGALGGRLGAYRDAFASENGSALLCEALSRNVWRGSPPEGEPEALEAATRALAARIALANTDDLLKGDIR